MASPDLAGIPGIGMSSSAAAAGAGNALQKSERGMKNLGGVVEILLRKETLHRFRCYMLLLRSKICSPFPGKGTDLCQELLESIDHSFDKDVDRDHKINYRELVEEELEGSSFGKRAASSWMARMRRADAMVGSQLVCCCYENSRRAKSQYS